MLRWPEPDDTQRCCLASSLLCHWPAHQSIGLGPAVLAAKVAVSASAPRFDPLFPFFTLASTSSDLERSGLRLGLRLSSSNGATGGDDAFCEYPVIDRLGLYLRIPVCLKNVPDGGCNLRNDGILSCQPTGHRPADRKSPRRPLAAARRASRSARAGGIQFG